MTKITKEEFEALPESLKAKFKAEGEGFVLIEEDVDGLKKSKAEILEEKKKLQAERDELAKFKAEKEDAEKQKKLATLEEEREYKKALAEKEKAWEERYEAEKLERNSLLTDIKRERLTNELVKRGALPDRASYLVGELDQIIDLVKGDAGYQLQKKGGIGDADEFDSVIETAKQRTPFFFAGTTQTGGGATGSGNNAGGGKTMPEAQFDSLSPQEQAAFISSGGQPV